MFEQLYFVGQRERQPLMYSLGICVSYSTYLVIFMAHNGSREALNFLELHYRLPHRLHHNYLIKKGVLMYVSSMFYASVVLPSPHTLEILTLSVLYSDFKVYLCLFLSTT